MDIKPEPLIFELEKSINKSEYTINDTNIPDYTISDELVNTENIEIPSLPERELIKHYINLSYENFGVDCGFYPLGSCTMKYNPKISEQLVMNDKLTDIHPLQPENSVQGIYELLYILSEKLNRILGFEICNLQPAAGAHGELAAMYGIKNYFHNQPDKINILIPDSAHGTNPASAKMAGFNIIKIPTDEQGMVNPETLKEYVNKNTAGIMLTNPNTLGLFEKYIVEIADMIHSVDGLLYYDGANLNANLGYTNPGKMGFDIAHINLHKTFGTPHGGGGPGAGTVLAKNKFKKYLPGFYIQKKSDNSYFKQVSEAGMILGFNSNIEVLLKGLIYIILNGNNGLKNVSETAVLNANYLKEKLKQYFYLPYDYLCKHEFVINDFYQKKYNVNTTNIAKRLIDFKIHPPTVYFPLIVKNAIMIEPTETENKETLDKFIEVMIQICKECENQSQLVLESPNYTVIKHPDETLAVKSRKLTF